MKCQTKIYWKRARIQRTRINENSYSHIHETQRQRERERENNAGTNVWSSERGICRLVLVHFFFSFRFLHIVVRSSPHNISVYRCTVQVAARLSILPNHTFAHYPLHTTATSNRYLHAMPYTHTRLTHNHGVCFCCTCVLCNTNRNALSWCGFIRTKQAAHVWISHICAYTHTHRVCVRERGNDEELPTFGWCDRWEIWTKINRNTQSRMYRWEDGSTAYYHTIAKV